VRQVVRCRDPDQGDVEASPTQAVMELVIGELGDACLHVWVVGAFADGLRGDLSLLAVRSLLDGFAMLAFAAYLGWGVAVSGLAVLVYQGGLTALAQVLQQVMTRPWWPP
jgi:uncharacterized membrane protein YqgA involved in biofilm formation